MLWMRCDKFTRTTEILWRKRDDTAALSVKERASPVPCLDRLLLLFWAHYIKDGPHLIHFRWLPFTENKGDDVVNYIKEEGYLQMQREMWLNWLHLSLGSLP